VVEVFYLTVITLVKISILLFYVSFKAHQALLVSLRTGLTVCKLRVFPGTKFRIANITTMAAVVLSSLAIFFAIIFQCIPVGENPISVTSFPLTDNFTSGGMGQNHPIQMC